VKFSQCFDTGGWVTGSSFNLPVIFIGSVLGDVVKMI